MNLKSCKIKHVGQKGRVEMNHVQLGRVLSHELHELDQTVPQVCDLPSFVRGLLTTYCLTSSSLARLKSLRILLALLGPRRRGTVLSVSPGMSFSPENQQVKNTETTLKMTYMWSVATLKLEHWDISQRTRAILNQIYTTHIWNHCKLAFKSRKRYRKNIRTYY